MIAPHVQRRRGMTLIELLVVAAVMMILVFVAIPSITPTTTVRSIREAARAVDIFFGAARNQAVASGRRVGVMLERLPGQPDACVTLYQVEEPPPYCGEFYNAQVSVTLNRDAMLAIASSSTIRDRTTRSMPTQRPALRPFIPKYRPLARRFIVR